MEKQQIIELLKGMGIAGEINETREYPEISVPVETLHDTALKLKNSPEFNCDFMVSATAIDWKTHFTVVYHLTSSTFHHVVVLKTNVSERENPEVDTLMDIWPAAEFKEREIFDLFGIKFKNHSDLRRLFLEDGWGFPLRKDYTDERIKELK